MYHMGFYYCKKECFMYKGKRIDFPKVTTFENLMVFGVGMTDFIKRDKTDSIA